MYKYQGEELEYFEQAKVWKSYFSSKVKKYIQGDVLEVGAGIGTNTKYLLTGDTTSWTYLELDAGLASMARKNTSSIGLQQKFIVGTIDNISNERYDTIIYIDVLEHISDSQQEVTKTTKLLSKGGHLIILVPAFQYLFSAYDTSVGHFRRYNKRQLRAEINDFLKEKELYFLDSCGWFASLMNKLMLDKPAISMSQLLFWDRILVSISKISDVVTLNAFGKSLVGVWEKK